MSEREQLIREIAQTPDLLVKEVLDFLLFIKARTNQDYIQTSNQSAGSQSSNNPSFLSFIDRLNAEITIEDRSEFPNDFSKNLDHYLYGSPKEE